MTSRYEFIDAEEDNYPMTKMFTWSAVSSSPWRPVTTVAGDASELPDLLKRDFTATRPGTKLVGDIIYSAQLLVMCSSAI